LRLEYSDVEAFPIQVGNGEVVPKEPGIAVEILENAAKDLDLEVEFVRRPNKRVLFELEKGRADGAFCYSFKETRLKAGVYPMTIDSIPDSKNRITAISYYLYKKRNSTLDWDGKKFINLKGPLGGNRGYSIVKDLREKGVEVEEAKTTEQNMFKLQKGRIAGYAMQDITADSFVESGQYGDIVRIPTPLATKDYFLIFSHQFIAKHPDICKKLWNKIGELRDSVTKENVHKYQHPTK